MNKNIIGIGVVILIIIIGGAFWLGQENSTEELMMEKEEDVMMEEHEDTMIEKENDVMMKEEEAMMEQENDVMEKSTADYQGEVLAGSTSPLLTFNQADYDQAVAGDKLVLLYFYANWCPTCKAEFPKAEAAFDQLNQDQVVGFRVNFNDNETDSDEKALARKYGVPYQHTKVLVKNGEQILKSPETWDESRYIEEISNALN